VIEGIKRGSRQPAKARDPKTHLEEVYVSPEQTTTASGLIRVHCNSDGIPDYLKIRPQFVSFNAKLKPNGKLDKVPMIPGTRRRASTTELLTWSPFDEAYAAYEDGKHDGIGFVFCSADPFVGIDFDDCRDPDTGEVDPQVLEYVEGFEKRYVEVSVSGTGIHLITRGKIQGGTKKGEREVYDQDRFFALTGVAL
jgi:putative DNA primase/helicase